MYEVGLNQIYETLGEMYRTVLGGLGDIATIVIIVALFCVFYTWYWYVKACKSLHKIACLVDDIKKMKENECRRAK